MMGKQIKDSKYSKMTKVPGSTVRKGIISVVISLHYLLILSYYLTILPP